jgi:hypothetical protein
MVHHTKIVAVAAVVGLIAGCSDSPTNPPAGRLGPVPQFTRGQAEGPKRDDTPWRRMTDAQLTAKVAEAGGRVFIGFREPGE